MVAWQRVVLPVETGQEEMEAAVQDLSNWDKKRISEGNRDGSGVEEAVTEASKAVSTRRM